MFDAMFRPQSLKPHDDRKELILAHQKRDMQRELRAKGYSKSAALRMTSEHFSTLVKGNENVAQ